MASHQEKRMHMALALAQEGIGSVEPNPVVGCLIEKEGRIIGQGWHRAFGGPHAEINAITDCLKQGNSPNGATLYVTLEPCCHQGKTGPCTKAIIEAQVQRVVIAAADPSEKVDGKGIAQLRQAGMDVQVGICEQQARLFNAPFYHQAITGNTWVVLKWAQSLDGNLGYKDPTHDRWISGQLSQLDCHILRRRTQAILVGINTVLADNPLLTPRPAQGRNPLRIVLDNTLRIPLNSQLVVTAPQYPLLIVTRQEAVENNLNKVEKLRQQSVELLTLPAGTIDSSVSVVYRELCVRGIQQLLVEGGAQVISSFLKEGHAHELVVYVCPLLLGSEGTISIGSALKALPDMVSLHQIETTALGSDIRFRGFTQASLDSRY
jgi:diaminohydroxyphosphoribosylaminopyrimidine deaminase / 5-amino-6-(5-phosphoribosylamino)uracil reductase